MFSICGVFLVCYCFRIFFMVRKSVFWSIVVFGFRSFFRVVFTYSVEGDVVFFEDDGRDESYFVS